MMKRYIGNFREYGVLVGCILLSLFLLYSNKSSQINALKAFSLNASGFLHSIHTYYLRYVDIEKENRFLREQNTLLALENSRMREAMLENDRLKRLIGFKTEYPARLIPAKVVGGNSSGIVNYILLDVGRDHGIRLNMPIVLPEGLVGKILRVGSSHSLGHILFDQNFRVSAKVQRSGVRGIISWNGGKLCDFNEVPNRSDVQPGDRIVTSGYSQIFPEGIYIGTVTMAENTKRSLSMRLKVRPDVDFDRLEEVLIIADTKPVITEQ